MPITKDGLIAGGRVTESGGLLTSAEYRKTHKMKFFDKVFFFVGLGMLVTGTVTLFFSNHITVTAETGFTDNNSKISSAIFNYVLAFYNMFVGLSPRWISIKARKKMLLGSFLVLLFALVLVYKPILDPPSLKYNDWAKERYGITQIDKTLTDKKLIAYKIGDEEKVAEVRSIDGKSFLYDPDADTELPRASK